MFANPTVIPAIAMTAMIAFSGSAFAADREWNILDQVRTPKPIVSEADTPSVDEPTGCEHFSAKARKYTKNGPCIAVSGYVRVQIGNMPD